MERVNLYARAKPDGGHVIPHSMRRLFSNCGRLQERDCRVDRQITSLFKLEAATPAPCWMGPELKAPLLSKFACLTVLSYFTTVLLHYAPSMAQEAQTDETNTHQRHRHRLGYDGSGESSRI